MHRHVSMQVNTERLVEIVISRNYLLRGYIPDKWDDIIRVINLFPCRLVLPEIGRETCVQVF